MVAKYLVFNRYDDVGFECATLKNVEQCVMEKVAEGCDMVDIIVYENPKGVSLGFALVTPSE